MVRAMVGKNPSTMQPSSHDSFICPVNRAMNRRTVESPARIVNAIKGARKDVSMPGATPQIVLVMFSAAMPKYYELGQPRISKASMNVVGRTYTNSPEYCRLPVRRYW